MHDAFVVHKDSWHYRWLCFYNASLTYAGRRRPGLSDRKIYEDFCCRPYDFCDYWRKVALWPALRIGTHLALYALAVWFLLNTSSEGAISLGLFVLGFGLLAALVLTIYGIIIGAVWLVKRYTPRQQQTGSRPSLINTAYKAWKHKFCPNLSYEEGTK